MDDKLKNTLTRLIKDQIPKQTVPAFVKSVNEEAATCEAYLVEDPDVILYNVRLRSVNNDTNKGFVIIPEDESPVLISMIDNSDQQYYVSVCSTIKKIIVINDEGRSFEISDKIKLNGADYGGLIKIEDLVVRINNIENDINVLKNIFKTWVVAPTDGGAVLKIASSIWSGSNLSQTTKSQIENNKVLHG